MTEWYVEVVVHAVVDADSPTAALETICDQIRAGIGEEGPEGTERPNRIAIAASRVRNEDKPEDVYLAHNEAWLARKQGFRT